MMSMDTAARALDAMLHQGYAEERDGGVWLDDLAARQLVEDLELAAEGGWEEVAQDLRVEVKDLERDVKQWKKRVSKVQEKSDKYRTVARACATAVNGKGQMREKLAKVRELTEGVW